MYLPLLPPLDFSLNRNKEMFPFSAAAKWLPSGRAALEEILLSLGVERGGEVLLPAYMCAEVVGAVLQMGFAAGFYRVPQTLFCSIADIQPYLTDKTRAVVLPHYFGLPQPHIHDIRRFADSRRILLIEDCAHSLMGDIGGAPIGTIAHASFFSPRKMVGIPHSGVAHYPEAGGGMARSAASSGRVLSREVASLALRSLSMKLGVRLGRGGGKPVVPSERNEPPEGEPADGWRRPADPGTLRFLAGHVDLQYVHFARKKNYHLLNGLLGGNKLGGDARPFLARIPDGEWTPFAFPLWLDSGQKAVQAKLLDAGIDAATWPRLSPLIDREHFPDTFALKEHILLLPVHQAMDHGQAERMIALLRRACATVRSGR